MATPNVRTAVATGRSRSLALLTELERQVGTLVRRGLPQLCGVPVRAFVALFAPLRDVVQHVAAGSNEAPFVVVPPPSLVTTADAMRIVRHRGEPGRSLLARVEADARITRSALAHVAIGIAARDGGDRTPLTIDEGIALATHFPELASRANGLALVDAGRRAVLRMDERGPTLEPATACGSFAIVSCRERSVGHAG